MKRPWCFFLALLLLMPLLAFAAETVDNPAEPRLGRQDVMLEELWRIGGWDDEENLLGVISEALVDEEGRLYLLDVQLVQVQVFDAEGHFLHSLGQEGEGPGEIRRPGGMVFMPDGTLGLVQVFPGKVVKLTLGGAPAGEYHPGGTDPAEGGFFGLRHLRSRGGHMVVAGGRMTRGEGRMEADQFVAAFAPDGAEKARYHGEKRVREFRRQEISEKDEFYPFETWDVGEDGRVYIAENRNGYSISVYNSDGSLERIIKRPYESYERSAQQRQRAEQEVMPWRRRNRGAVNIVVEPTEQDIRFLRVAADGRLWVLTSRGALDQPAGVHSTWDVFDPQGGYEKIVSLHAEGQSPGDRIFFAGGDTIVLVRHYEEAMKAFRGSNSGEEEPADESLDAEPLEVIVYRMTP